MVESIYTIPLTDAMEEDTPCMFCFLEEKLEREQIEYALGAAMMEPDFRIISNEKGYCRHHAKMMVNAQKALPLALVNDTRCDEVLKKLKSLDPTKKGGIFKKGKSFSEDFCDVSETLASTCLICERIEKTMDKFCNTFWYLYGKESDFREKFLAGKGVCIHHLQSLMNALMDVGASKREAFAKELYDLEIKVLEHEKEQVHGFTRQFDYRSDKGEWNVARDAHILCAGRLSGFIKRD